MTEEKNKQNRINKEMLLRKSVVKGNGNNGAEINKMAENHHSAVHPGSSILEGKSASKSDDVVNVEKEVEKEVEKIVKEGKEGKEGIQSVNMKIPVLQVNKDVENFPHGNQNSDADLGSAMVQIPFHTQLLSVSLMDQFIF